MSLTSYALLLTLSCGFALWRGGWPERSAAALIIAGWGLSMLIDLPLAIRYFSVSGAIAAIDFGMMVGFAVLALRADRYWPIIMAALQLVMILGHLIKWLDSELIRRTYIILIAYPAWLHLLVLIAATTRHIARERTSGPRSEII